MFFCFLGCLNDGCYEQNQLMPEKAATYMQPDDNMAFQPASKETFCLSLDVVKLMRKPHEINW